MVRCEDDYMECGPCGQHWFSIESKSVIDLSYEKIADAVRLAVRQNEQLLLVGDIRYSREDTKISCAGAMKLGVLGLTCEAKQRYMRATSGDPCMQVDQAREREHSDAVLSDDVEPSVGLPLGMLCGFLVYNWHIRRSVPVYRRRLDAVSFDKVVEALAGEADAGVCAELSTIV
jgi:hypothetical protein